MSIPGNANPLLLASAADAAPAAVGTKSLRFNSGDSAYLSRTPSSAGNRKTWTWSAWIKIGKLSNWGSLFKAGDSDANPTTQLYLYSDNTLEYITYDAATKGRLLLSQFFRDPSAWYHIVLAIDTTDATADNRQRIYINGAEVTDFGSRTNHAQNYETFVNSSSYAHEIGRTTNIGGSSQKFFDGYMADIYFIDGSALDPTSFGAFDDNGVWQAIGYSGTYGTNGFHLLDFANESTIGHDSSGNENDFTGFNFSDSAGAGNDVLFDVPTNGDQSDTGAGGEVSGNYPTLNPLKKANISTSNGNLDFSHSGTTGNWQVVFSTIGMTSGKYYCEFTCADADSVIGIAKDSHTIANDKYVGNDPNGWGYNGQNGQKLNNSSGSSYGNSFTSGDVIGIAFDATNGSLYFYKNGTAQNSGTAAFTGLTDGPYFFAFSIRDTGSTHSVNFGQRSFSYSAPTNYVALNTASLPTPTIADGSDYFETVIWTGTGASKSLTTGFSPDFIWLKNRAISSNHRIFDTVRGQGVMLHTNTNNTDQSDTNNLTSFDSNGFTVGTNSNTNGSGNGIVAWCWDAGSSTVSNTDGSVTSQVRVNQSAGFSIVSYTATGSNLTVGHGLNATPALIIHKTRSAARDWVIYHESLGLDYILKLNLTDAKLGPFTTIFTSVSSSTFGTGNNSGINTNGETKINYCISPVAGYSAVGSYEGNGSSTAGPFISTGFRVNYLLVKNTTTTSPWFIFDAVRDPENTNGKILRANDTTSEFDGGTEYIDFLSNGFKLRTNIDQFNRNGDTYIYWAIAENPFQANGGLAR